MEQQQHSAAEHKHKPSHGSKTVYVQTPNESDLDSQGGEAVNAHSKVPLGPPSSDLGLPPSKPEIGSQTDGPQAYPLQSSADVPAHRQGGSESAAPSYDVNDAPTTYPMGPKSVPPASPTTTPKHAPPAPAVPPAGNSPSIYSLASGQPAAPATEIRKPFRPTRIAPPGNARPDPVANSNVGEPKSTYSLAPNQSLPTAQNPPIGKAATGSTQSGSSTPSARSTSSTGDGRSTYSLASGQSSSSAAQNPPVAKAPTGPASKAGDGRSTYSLASNSPSSDVTTPPVGNESKPGKSSHASMGSASGRKSGDGKSTYSIAPNSAGSDVTTSPVPIAAPTPSPTPNATRAPKTTYADDSHLTSQFPDAPRIGDIIGDCVIVEKLGEGGMGVVYKAVRRMLKRVVALKVLPKSIRDMAPSLSERFLIEAQAAAGLAHPAIVAVYNAGTDGDIGFIEMEFIDGQPISALLKRGPLAEPEAIRVILPIAEALDYAHQKSLIHRDVKPANILRTLDGRVKLSDFGLAGPAMEQTAGIDEAIAASQSRLTQYGTIMGTLGYMSPQQYWGEAVDGRTDIYALGATFYALLTGKPPCYERDPELMMRRQITEPILDICAVNRRVSRQTADVIHKALAKQVEDRYQTCGEMIADLKGSGGDSANPPPAAAENQEFWNSFAKMVRGSKRPGT